MSEVVLTFIIPLRHPQNARNWSVLKRILTQTMRSISGQDDGRWRAIIVANRGSDLPPLPEKFELIEVDFPPNPMHEQGGNSREAFLDSCRVDKGRRVLVGILAAEQSEFVMVVDDDDFVNRRLTSFAASQAGASGWYMEDGYIWGDGGRLIYKFPLFWRFCGTSHIVRRASYEVPASLEAADLTYVRRIFGCHVYARDYLAKRGVPLEPLPFLGAIYRLGHINAHSKSPSLLRQVFYKRELIKNPWQLPWRISRLRFLNAEVRRQFWG
jgi:hypothetical protein